MIEWAWAKSFHVGQYPGNEGDANAGRHCEQQAVQGYLSELSLGYCIDVISCVYRQCQCRDDKPEQDR